MSKEILKGRYQIKNAPAFKTEVEQKKDLFISYSWKNKDKVHELCDKLKQKGYNLWWDRNDMKNDVLDEIMQKGIDQSKLFVCCVSTDYCKKDEEGNPKNALKEHQYATANNKKIIYILFEKYENKNVMKERLYNIWFNFSKRSYFKHDNIGEIIKAIDESLREGIEPEDSFQMRKNVQRVQVRKLCF